MSIIIELNDFVTVFLLDEILIKMHNVKHSLGSADSVTEVLDSNLGHYNKTHQCFLLTF